MTRTASDSMLDNTWREAVERLIEDNDLPAVLLRENETLRMVEEIKGVAKVRLKQRTFQELLDVCCHS